MVRDRSEVQSDTLRRPEMLPPSEIESAITDIVEKNFGASPDEIILAVSRAFGFKATSGQLREVIQARIDALLQTSRLLKQGENLVAAEKVRSA